ncbi:MAG: hypothetical protein BWY31_00524 [Lentisphaerae bacterium ADurb.Bin242]|nr:MAG: hypothetical protein BWY31_00524 [Lentisphaerae bacterium ADurb.Bin242]
MDQETAKKLQKEQENAKAVYREILDAANRLGISIDAVDASVKLLDGIASARLDLNNEQAKKLYALYWHKIQKSIKVKGTFSELEILKILNEHDSVLQVTQKMSLLLVDMKRCADTINKAKKCIESAVDVWELIHSARDSATIENQTRNVKDSIREMREAKEKMNKVLKITRELSGASKIPLVGATIDCLIEIFEKTDGICDKSAGYAMRLVDETEKVLGTRGEAINMFNKNTAKSMLDEEIFKMELEKRKGKNYSSK